MCIQYLESSPTSHMRVILFLLYVFFFVVEPLGACERRPHSGNQQEPVFSLMYGVYSISLRSICRL